MALEHCDLHTIQHSGHDLVRLKFVHACVRVYLSVLKRLDAHQNAQNHTHKRAYEDANESMINGIIAAWALHEQTHC